MNTDEFAELLRAAVLLPALRAPDRTTALEQVDHCVGAGLPIVELTTTIPDWVGALREVRASWPDVVVGVGTVLEPEQAEAAAASGAHFLVSPCPVPAVRKEIDLPLIEGGFTPGELLDATSRGIGKLFPAHVGGPQMLRSILALRPTARIVATGGITLAAVPDWLAAGALAVGLGTNLFEVPDLAAQVSSLASSRRMANANAATPTAAR